jgi:hypothetical protein
LGICDGVEFVFCGPKRSDPYTKMDQAPIFELASATREDIPRLAHIHVVAYLPDNAFKLYFSTPQEFEKRVTEMLEGQVGDPTWQHIKAVDKNTGEIAAWASWNMPTDAQIRERMKKLRSRARKLKKARVV